MSSPLVPVASDQPSPLIARFCIVAAAVLWSTSGWFAKNPVFHEWPAEQRGMLLAFWRAAFAGGLLLPFVRRPSFQPILVPMTLTFAAMNGVYLSAVVLTTAANAIWLQNTAPLWVFLAGLTFFGERATRPDVVLLVFGLSGVAAILAFEAAGQEKVGVACGLASGVAYAGVVLFMRKLRDMNPAWLVALNLLVTAAILFPYVVYQNIWPTPGQLALLAAFGLFQMGLPYVLFFHGLRSVPGQEAVGIALLEPVLLPIWVYLSVGEVPRAWSLAGGGMILFGLAIRYGVPILKLRGR